MMDYLTYRQELAYEVEAFCRAIGYHTRPEAVALAFVEQARQDRDFMDSMKQAMERKLGHSLTWDTVDTLNEYAQEKARDMAWAQYHNNDPLDERDFADTLCDCYGAVVGMVIGGLFRARVRTLMPELSEEEECVS